MRINSIQAVFTEYIPEAIDDGIIYISMEYATASHRCACGCGQEVVTPFSPTDWKLSYDGETVSLTPSIGNWSYPCRAHYFIRNNQIVWAREMSSEAIRAGRRQDRRLKEDYYAQTSPSDSCSLENTERAPRSAGSSGFWRRIARVLGLSK